MFQKFLTLAHFLFFFFFFSATSNDCPLLFSAATWAEKEKGRQLNTNEYTTTV